MRAADEANGFARQVGEGRDAVVAPHQQALGIVEHRASEPQPVCDLGGAGGRGPEQEIHFSGRDGVEAMPLVGKGPYRRLGVDADGRDRNRAAQVGAKLVEGAVQVGLAVVLGHGDHAASQRPTLPDRSSTGPAHPVAVVATSICCGTPALAFLG